MTFLDHLEIGLRIALIVLFGAKIAYFAWDESDVHPGHRARHVAYLLVAIAVVLFFSPNRILILVDESLPGHLQQASRILGSALLLASVVMWARARMLLAELPPRMVARHLRSTALVVLAAILTGFVVK